jgi:hypothetical protein
MGDNKWTKSRKCKIRSKFANKNIKQWLYRNVRTWVVERRQTPRSRKKHWPQTGHCEQIYWSSLTLFVVDYFHRWPTSPGDLLSMRIITLLLFPRPLSDPFITCPIRVELNWAAMARWPRRCRCGGCSIQDGAIDAEVFVFFSALGVASRRPPRAARAHREIHARWKHDAIH